MSPNIGNGRNLASRLASAALAIVLVVLPFTPGTGGGFIFDDISNIVNNKPLHLESMTVEAWSAAAFSSPSSDLQRPLAMASFAANTWFTGLDPAPMKWTNIGIHLLNTGLVFWLSLLLAARSQQGPASEARKHRFALFVALAWALNPINFTAVLYVVQRMESLCHLFVFAGLILYVQGREAQLRGEPGWGRIIGGLVGGTLLGLTAKESAVLLPLYAFVLEAMLYRFQGPAPTGPRLKAMFAAGLWIPAVLGGAWMLSVSLRPASYSGRDFTLVERLLTEPRILVDYLHWSVVPDVSKMGLYHDAYPVSHGLLDPPSTVLAILSLGVLAVAAWRLRRRLPLACTGFLLFLAAHALTGTFISLELMYEHRNYFASFGLMLGLGELLLLRGSASAAARLLPLLAVLAVLVYAASTWSRAAQWSDPVTFARAESLRHRDSPRAQYDMARILVIMSTYDRKSPYWVPARDAIDRAIRVPGGGILPLQAALIFDARSGLGTDPADWRELENRLLHQPIRAETQGAIASLTECANTKQCKFDPQAMLGMFSAALTHGDNPELLNVYGSYALHSLKDIDLCERLWQEAARLRPSEAQYRINLGKLHTARKQWEEAEADIVALRAIGRAGQNDAAADALAADLAKARLALGH